MSELVREHRNDLLGVALLYQSIVDDNVLLPREAKEVGIAVSAALAAVNDEELGQRELQLLGQLLNSILELARFQRRELVEQRENCNWIDRDHEDLQACAKEPQVVEELGARPLDD